MHGVMHVLVVVRRRKIPVYRARIIICLSNTGMLGAQYHHQKVCSMESKLSITLAAVS